MNYDLSLFHPQCKNKAIQVSFDGKIYIWCGDCQILADVEAVGGKIAPMEAIRWGTGLERTIIGDQSPGCDRGGKK